MAHPLGTAVLYPAALEIAGGDMAVTCVLLPNFAPGLQLLLSATVMGGNGMGLNLTVFH